MNDRVLWRWLMPKTPVALFCGPFLVACGSLEVERLQPGAMTDGVVYSMPVQDFVITINGLDKDNKPVLDEDAPRIVSLVTRADPERVFSVRNDPAWFSDSGFSITRSADGRVEAISGSSTGKAAEVVTALVSIVASVAAARPAALDDLEKELENLKDVKTELMTQLKAQVSGAKDEERVEGKDEERVEGKDEERVEGKDEERVDGKDREVIEQLLRALALTQQRISVLELEKQALIAKSKQRPAGVKPSSTQVATVDVAASADDAKGRSKSLKRGEIAIYLVQVPWREEGGQQ